MKSDLETTGEGYRLTLLGKLAGLRKLHGLQRWQAELAVVRSADPAEEGTLAFDRELLVGLCNQGSRLTQEVAAALGRIEAGTFGECVECSEPIAARRLAAIPWAARCIRCQERSEQAAQAAQDDLGFEEAA